MSGAGETAAEPVTALLGSENKVESKPELHVEVEAKPDVGEQDAADHETESKGAASVDTELEAMKLRLQQMEAESMAMKPDNSEVGISDDGVSAQGEGTVDPTVVAAATAAARAVVKEVNAGYGGVTSDQAVADADARSVYVGNVDYNSTVDELSAYFSECGTINRVTIMTHKPTGHPKGFAYIEFKDQHAVENAMILNESLFKGRQLKITPKRTNLPGVGRGGRRGRGGYGRARGHHFGRRPRARRGRWVPY